LIYSSEDIIGIFNAVQARLEVGETVKNFVKTKEAYCVASSTFCSIEAVSPQIVKKVLLLCDGLFFSATKEELFGGGVEGRFQEDECRIPQEGL